MIVVFLPAFNEEQALPILVEKFHAELASKGAYQIVVMDDGSSDGTAAAAESLAKRYPLTLLRHEKNLGLGRTMADGLEYIAKNFSSQDVIVTLDCDDTHDPRYVHRALEKINEGWDVVILSRYQKGGGEEGLSAVRSVLSRGAGVFLKILFPIRGVQEYSCGYRVFRVSAVQKALQVFGDEFVKFPQMGFVVTPEILIKFRAIGLRTCEVPFVLDYGKKQTPSKNRPLRTIAGYFALVWHYWRPWRPAPRAR